MKKTALLVAALAAGTLLSGCSTYARPDTSSIGLMYTGGDWDTKTFQGCVRPGDNKAEDWGGTTAYYPTGVITVDFAARPDSEMGPIGVSTSNSQEIIQAGTTSVRLQGLDCAPYTDKNGKTWPGGKLQKFHEEVGQRNSAAFTADSSQRPAGWVPLLITFVGAPTERSLDQAGGAYTWQNIYGDAATQGAFAAEARRLLPEKMAAATGGEQYFDVLGVELDKPGIPEALKTQFQAAEQARIEQETATQKRDFQNAWPGGISGYQDFQRKEAETRCLNEGRCPVVVPGAFPAVR
jgi:hypothetical protein